ncbi:MAG TPA: C25 family peptidase propeptide domain-containing protein, partial [Bacteroidales bacterium]|nr:C25 family peptidase propeptide domain-containing protein [Bacteroidales bacterium]
MLALLFVYCAHTGYSSVPGNKGTILTIKENTYNKLVLVNSLSLQDIRTIKVNTAKGLFSEFIIPEYGASNAIGNPKLPVMKKLIEVPVGATVKINTLHSTYTDITLNDLGALFPVMPAQPSLSKSDDPKKADFKYNKAAYKLNQFLPHELATLTVLGTMRGTKLGRLEIAPLYYNPAKKTLRIYTSVEIEIVFENANVAATIQQKENFFSPYFAPSYSKIFNYKPLEHKANFTKYPVKYVIVADTMFYSSLQPFVQWKTKKGFTVVQAYTNNPAVGNTTTSIKSYLQNLYNAGTAADPAPSFVLLVGDVAQVPSFAGTEGSHVSDLYYCEYTGD